MPELLVETKQIVLEAVSLENGEKLGPITVVYETIGRLNAARSNAILIFHALSGDAHVAGRHSPQDKKPGWWDIMVGPGKAFDTDRYFIVCANILGGCQGTTGPSSINPATGQPYALDFPIVTIKDMVDVQIKLLDQLGIDSLLAAAGGSLGGMLTLQLAVSYPGRVRNIIAIATSAQVSAQNIAFNEVGRQAIMADPKKGLAIARMLGHITYLSDKSLREKFGRKITDGHKLAAKFGSPQFEIESYLQYKGAVFTERFDANSYLYISKAFDLFNLAEAGGGSLTRAFAKCASRFLVVHFSSDWLFPEDQALDIVNALKDNSLNVSYRLITSNYGHDAFLLEEGELTKAIVSFLAGAK